MAHDAHEGESSHDNPGILGGLLDGTAIGLGAGIFIGGMFWYRSFIPMPAWVGITGSTAFIGALLGSWWGKNRGY